MFRFWMFDNGDWETHFSVPLTNSDVEHTLELSPRETGEYIIYEG